MRSLFELKSLLSYKKLATPWKELCDFEWIHYFEENKKEDEIVKEYISIFENNEKLRDINIDINGIRFGIKQVYKFNSENITKKHGSIIKTNYRYFNICQNYDEYFKEDYERCLNRYNNGKRKHRPFPMILDSYVISIQPFAKANIYFNKYYSEPDKYEREYRIIRNDNNSIYKLIITNVGLFFKQGKSKVVPLTMKYLSKFINLICYRELKDDILDFIFDIFGDENYLIKDIKRNLKDSVFLQNVDFTNIEKYHNIKELFVDKHKKLPNINFNRNNSNLCYILIRVYNLIREEQLQLFINDFKENFYKFNNEILLTLNYNYKYKLLANILYVMYHKDVNNTKEDINDYNETKTIIGDYLDLCQLNKSKVNINIKNKNTLKKLHDIEMEKSLKKRKKRMNKSFNFDKSQFMPLIEEMPKKYNLINNEYNLYQEGQNQHNCVYTYLSEIKNGNCIIYNYIKGENHYTIEIRKRKEDNTYFLKQMKAKYNVKPVKTDYNEVINDINKINGICSMR